jgi:hypothetical protein
MPDWAKNQRLPKASPAAAAPTTPPLQTLLADQWQPQQQQRKHTPNKVNRPERLNHVGNQWPITRQQPVHDPRNKTRRRTTAKNHTSDDEFLEPDDKNAMAHLDELRRQLARLGRL